MTAAKAGASADDIAIRRDFIGAGDIELHERVCVIETQPMLLIPHGGSGASSLLGPLLRQGAWARRVFAFGIRGFGDSTSIASTRSLAVSA